MKLQENPTLNFNQNRVNRRNSNKSQNHSQPSFKGGEAVTAVMNFLQTSPAVGATIVDVTCMGAPRSAVDFTRSPEAGIETMRREFSSTGNDALLGVYGMGAAMLLAHNFNKKYDIKAHGLFIDDDATDVLTNIRNDKPNQKEFLTEVVSRMKGYNPTSETESKENAYKSIKPKDQKIIVERLDEELTKYDELDKVSKKYLNALITKSTGVEDRFKIEYNGLKMESSLDEMLDGLFKMTKIMSKEKVAKTFNGGKLSENDFIKSLKSLNKRTAFIGIGISVAIGLCVQPFNAYLTKRKTGKSGFVGGGEENKTAGFKLLKAEIATLGAYAALKTIGDGKIKNLAKHIQFKSLIPTINQFKFLYGAKIVSRILSSRNDNELRETTFKDSLAFVNWLILGGFISKLTANLFEKASKDKYIRYNENVDGAGKFNWLTKSSTMTRNEVLIEAYEKLGLDTMKHDGVAKTMKEMLKELKSMRKSAPEAAKALAKIKNLGLIQFAGYLYSGIVLGVGLPKLNIAMTKALNKHKEKKQETTKAVA